MGGVLESPTTQNRRIAMPPEPEAGPLKKRGRKQAVGDKKDIVTPPPPPNMEQWLQGIQKAQLDHRAVGGYEKDTPWCVVLPQDLRDPNKVFTWLTQLFPIQPALTLPSWYKDNTQPLLRYANNAPPQQPLGAQLPSTDLQIVAVTLVPPTTTTDRKTAEQEYQALLTHPTPAGLAGLALIFQHPQYMWSVMKHHPLLCVGLEITTPGARQAGALGDELPTWEIPTVIPAGVQGRMRPSVTPRAKHAAGPVWSARLA